MNNLMVIDGIEVRRDAYGRYSLNDLHRAAGGEQKNRPKSLTVKGCMFGKNITSPANPRETQPHFFESRFPELLKLLNTVH